MNPLLAALMAHLQGGGAAGAPPSVGVNADAHPEAQSAGGADALKAALSDIHQFVETADDEQDRQVALQCYAKLQAILANEQKERESALGVTPQTKFLAKNSSRGPGY